jgi:hypothetical protein
MGRSPGRRGRNPSAFVNDDLFLNVVETPTAWSSTATSTPTSSTRDGGAVVQYFEHLLEASSKAREASVSPALERGGARARARRMEPDRAAILLPAGAHQLFEAQAARTWRPSRSPSANTG